MEAMDVLKNYPHTGWVIVGIIAFFCVRLGIGYWAALKVNNASDYIVAGRGLPLYMTAASIMATWFAAETLLGASSRAYNFGFHGVISDPFSSVVCLAVSGLFFIRLMRRARYLTVIDFFEKRFGREVSFVGAFVQIFAYLVWTAAQFVAGGHIVEALLGWNMVVGVILVGTVVTLYTMMGGMLADTLLDFIQMFFTVGGITAVFLFLLYEVGGVQGLLDHGGSRHVAEPFALLPIAGVGYLGYTGFMGWSYWISAWLAIGLGSVATQDLMQRSMSARNEAASVWGSYIAGILYFGFGVMSPLVGIMVYKLNPNIHEDHVESLLLITSTQYLPVWLNVLFIASLTSAMMSTSDSAILAGASMFTENVLPIVQGQVDDVRKLWWTRAMVLIIGVICIGIALIGGETYRLALMAWTVLLVGMFAPFAFGMYWKNANRTGSLAAILSGIGTWITLILLVFPVSRAQNTTSGELDLEGALWDAVYISATPATIVSILAMLVVSWATVRWDPPLPLTDVDGELLSLTNRLGWLSIREVFRPDPEQAGRAAVEGLPVETLPQEA